MAKDIDPKQTCISANAAAGQMPVHFEKAEQPGILDLLLILSAKKRLIFLSVLVCGFLAALVSFIISPTYTATAVIMPPQQPSSSASALLGQLNGIGSLMGQSMAIRNPSDLYIGILSSRSVAYKIIAQFKLKDIYKARTMSDARRKLASRTNFDSAKNSLIQISVEAQNAVLAANLANAYVEQLQAQTSHLAITEASQRRLFFEGQLRIEKNQLTDAEEALKRTQEKKGIFQVGPQFEATIRSIAQMHAEITAREVSMQRLKAGATTQNPEVQRQEIELQALRSQLNELEAGSASKRIGNPLMPTTMVPAAGLEYARRLRELKYHEALFELLTEQYEAARIDEAKDSPIIQVVDQAIPPEKKTAPRRSLYIIIGIFLGGILGLIAAFVGYMAKDPARADKIAALKASLWSFGRKSS